MSGRRLNPPPNWPPLPPGFVPPDGWQPDPRWGEPPPGWQLWVDDGAAGPASGRIQAPGLSLAAARLAVAGALILAAVGLIVGNQPVSLLTGSGILYVGLALAAGGAILAFVVQLPVWVRVVCVVAVVLVAVNIGVVEHSLDQKRQQISRELTNLGR